MVLAARKVRAIYPQTAAPSMASMSPEDTPRTAVIRCACGWRFRGRSAEELVAAMERHVAAEHPALVGALSRADVLAMAEEE